MKIDNVDLIMLTFLSLIGITILTNSLINFQEGDKKWIKRYLRRK